MRKSERACPPLLTLSKGSGGIPFFIIDDWMRSRRKVNPLPATGQKGRLSMKKKEARAKVILKKKGSMVSASCGGKGVTFWDGVWFLWRVL
jgi:hypothetical protein